MKLDEFAFVNHQLAGMLRAGIPLEGALKQVAAGLNDGGLRTELEALEADLAKGIPLRDALSRRQLPVFYSRMIEVGAQGNNLAALLTMLADYYQRAHVMWVRLKGLIFYPAVVLTLSLVVSLLVAMIISRFSRETLETFGQFSGTRAAANTGLVFFGIWFPVMVLGMVFGAAVLALSVPSWRQALRWRVPGFREAGLSNLASATALLLENGCSLNQALGLVQHLESASPMGAEVSRWQERLAEGRRQFPEIAAGGTGVVPPLFIWLVASAGEDWLSGFRHAAQVYHERAHQRVETMLYAVLPASVLALGFLILVQVLPAAGVFGRLTGGLFDATAMN